MREETRRLILEAAEAEFASRGFAPARLGDIAERVGITRAAVIYHYGDKQSLYDAVLESVFHFLTQRIEEQVCRAEDAGEVAQIEAMFEAWIECSYERPTLARLYMREVADDEQGFRPEVERLVAPLFAGIIEQIEKAKKHGAIRPLDPHHLVTILAGAVTWYATSASLLASAPTGGRSEPERFTAYRDELMRITRFLLGTLPEEERG